MRILFAVLALSIAARAQCNIDSAPSNCPAVSPATAGSTTPTAIPNTGYTNGGTTMDGVKTIQGVPYNAAYPGSESVSGPTGGTFGSMSVVSAYWPYGGNVDTAHLMKIFCIHGGGGIGGAWFTCFGGGIGGGASSFVWSPVALIDLYLNTPNKTGGRGIVVIEFEYPLANVKGTNVWPTPWWALQCARNWFATSSVIPGSNAVWGVLGPSWGGFYSWIWGHVPNNFYPSTGNTYGACPNGDVIPPPIRTASLWPPTTLAMPDGNSSIMNVMYPYGTGHNPATTLAGGIVQTAMTNGINYTLTGNAAADSTAMAAIDANLKWSMYQLITNANRSWATTPQFWEFGGAPANISGACTLTTPKTCDPTVMPYWPSQSAPVGGHAKMITDAFAALSPPITMSVTINAGQDHEGDLQLPSLFSPQAMPQSIVDAVNFLVSGPDAVVVRIFPLPGGIGRR